MRKTITATLSEAKGKFNAYTALLQYRYSNLCVEADGNALLSVVVKIDYTEKNLEEVAIIGNPSVEKFAIFPKQQYDLPEIIKAVILAHPEFKMEIKDWENYPEDFKEEGEEYKYLEFTMPEVNKDRRDVLLDGVKVLHEQWDGKMQAVRGSCTARLTATLTGQDKNTIEKVTAQLDDLYDTYHGMGEKLMEDKKKEIEEGYQRYLKQQAEQQTTEKAQGQGAGSAMKMGEGEEEIDDGVF